MSNADLESTSCAGEKPTSPHPPAVDLMFLHGIEVFARHGVFEFERQAGQAFVIDVDWWLETAEAVESDLLADTVCYADLHDCVCEAAKGEACYLIELLAHRIVAALFKRFEKISAVRVTVRKPDAPINGVFSDVGITTMRMRPANLG